MPGLSHKPGPVICCCGGRGMVSVSHLFATVIIPYDSQVFGTHSVRISASSRAGSSVAKLASQRAARELARTPAS